MARFLTACGAIPVYRKQDDPGKMDRNADTFTACSETLSRGGLIGIYPEGTTHAEARVQRIKTGAARIALEYESRRVTGIGAPLALVPVGLTFDARKSFRGRVRVAGQSVIITARFDPADHIHERGTRVDFGRGQPIETPPAFAATLRRFLGP